MSFPVRNGRPGERPRLREASPGFPALTPELTSSLLEAACLLGAADRAGSRRVLFEAVASQVSGISDLRDRFRRALDAGLVDLAAECLAAIERATSTCAKEDWLGEARWELGNATPFTAERLRRLLKDIPKRSRPSSSRVICYVLHMSLPYNTTGYAMRTQEFAKEMAATGRELHCLTRPGFPSDVGQEMLLDWDVVDGVVYHRIPTPSRIEFRNTSYVERAADILTRKFEELRPSIIMAASNHETAAPALLAARRLGIPFVYEMRGFWELTKISVNPWYREDPQFQRSFELEAKIAQEADQVFTLTEAMTTELRRRGVSNPRIRTLPNAADPNRFRPGERDREFARQIGIGDRTVVIGYIGSFTLYEGLDDLIRACAILHRRGRDFHLLLIGNEAHHMKDRVMPELRDLARSEGIEEQTTMTGRVPAFEVERWYSLVDISPIPRRSTPVTELVSPLKPFEAMAMGKAVLLPDLPSMLEIAEDGRTGAFYQRGNYKALADGLDDLLSSPEKRNALGQAARRRIATERNWKAVVEHCLSALADIEGVNTRPAKAF